MADDEPTTRFEGYSDYQTVSSSIARSIDDAIEAYAALKSRHVEGARIRPEMASQARTHILSAGLKLVPELRDNADADEEFQKILARWQGCYKPPDKGADDADVDDAAAADGGEITPNFNDYDISASTGFIDGLDDVSLVTQCPDWLQQFVIDIRVAGWELGYLRAGRTTKEHDLDPAEEEARAMFES